jgi:hypothetical protein
MGAKHREAHRLRVFEKKVLRRTFGPKRDELQLHNEELRDLYSSQIRINLNNGVKEDEVGGTCSPNGGKEKCV